MTEGPESEAVSAVIKKKEGPVKCGDRGGFGKWTKFFGFQDVLEG